MIHLGGLAQKSSEGRAGLARGSIGFFARGAPPFFGSFFGRGRLGKQKRTKRLDRNCQYKIWITQDFAKFCTANYDLSAAKAIGVVICVICWYTMP
jgi:hypothetical protein